MTTSHLRPFRALTLCLLCAPILLSCGITSSTSTSITKDCVIEDAQSGTISGKWSLTPVPIAFHEGDWTAAEIKSMIQAADTWNTFYAASKGLSTIDYGTSTDPRMSSATKPDGSCSTTLLSNGTFVAPVVIYKNTSWPSAYSSTAIAITKYCTRTATPFKNFYLAWVEFNYANYFSSGKKVPDLQTIMLHEFGHVMGLDHSCESTARTGVPSCTSNVKQAYVDAVMYPVFGFDSTGAGQQKRSLQTNDQERANCLY